MKLTESKHDQLMLPAIKVMRDLGFEDVIPNPTPPSKYGERVDMIGVARRENRETGWPVDGGSEDFIIRRADTLVLELKATRGDFHKDAEKRHRQQGPRYGIYFGFLCMRGLIEVHEVGKHQGLFWVDVDHTWECKKSPVRRNMATRDHEILLMSRELSRNAYERASNFLPKQTHQIISLKDRRPQKLSQDLIEINQYLIDNPGVKARKIIKDKRLDISPSKLIDRLERAGFPSREDGGVTYFKAIEAE